MRILLVEDDEAMGQATSRAMASQGWAVDWLRSGEALESVAKEGLHDLVVLDVGLSGIDGFEALRRFRARGDTVPVLMLTARDAVEDRVRGFETGADDYLVKPFAVAELVARINALVRRVQGRTGDCLAVGALNLDLSAKRATVAGAPVQLTLREWTVLVYLASHEGRVVSKEQIVEAVSNWDSAPSENAIEVYVSRLRRKLGDAGLAIRSVRGFGYLLEAQQSRQDGHAGT